PRLQEHLGIAGLAVIELLVGVWRVFKRQFLRHHEARFGTTSDDQIAELMRVHLYICLAGCHGLALFKEPSNPEQQLTFCRVFIWCTRIRWDIQSNNAQTAGVTDGID